MRLFTKLITNCANCPNAKDPNGWDYKLVYCSVTNRELKGIRLGYDIPDWCPLQSSSDNTQIYKAKIFSQSVELRKLERELWDAEEWLEKLKTEYKDLIEKYNKNLDNIQNDIYYDEETNTTYRFDKLPDFPGRRINQKE